jgi:hypothetical protein
MELLLATKHTISRRRRMMMLLLSSTTNSTTTTSNDKNKNDQTSFAVVEDRVPDEDLLGGAKITKEKCFDFVIFMVGGATMNCRFP